MIHLFDQDTGSRVGTITEDQLRMPGYYITRDMLELFEHNDADPALLSVLRTALGSSGDMDMRWERR